MTTGIVMSPALWVVVDSLAVARASWLIGQDIITAPGREWLRRRGWSKSGSQHHGAQARIARFAFDWASCAWCSSLWLAAAALAATVFIPDVWMYPALALAFSYVAGWMAAH